MDIPIIDTDTHLSEPPDLWTSRLPMDKWGSDVPHVVFDESRQIDRWIIGGRRAPGVGAFVSSKWPEFPPSHPPTREAADPGAFDADARIARMDENGIRAEVLFPNLYGFVIHPFLSIKDARLRLECIRAYNDFTYDFTRAAPSRFIMMIALPFWDVEACCREVERCHERGFRGVLFPSKPYKLDLPRLEDPHWAPLFKMAEERGLSINFHIGFQDFTEDEFKAMTGRGNTRARYARDSSLTILGLAEVVGDVLTSDVCIQYPNLKFVLVESGFGYLPYLLETLDWQWANTGAAQENPGRELPSYYFRQSVYSAFWYERTTIERMVDLYPDNVMFETDYPHSTSLSPGPASTAEPPRVEAERAIRNLSPELAHKLLYGNAARLYGVE
ncbi:MAG TPA: amidohydrolase family protein [Ilumatobacter sp.]|nr:amidohydrolase family protein [Ilumatobacter sp.]